MVVGVLFGVEVWGFERFVRVCMFVILFACVFGFSVVGVAVRGIAVWSCGLRRLGVAYDFFWLGLILLWF